MLHVLASGTLHTDPEIRISKTGDAFTIARIKHTAKDGGYTNVNCIAFSELGQRLARLAAGDAVSVSGPAALSAYESWTTGEPKASLFLTVEQLLTIKEPERPERQRRKRRRRARPDVIAIAGGADFDDDLPDM